MQKKISWVVFLYIAGYHLFLLGALPFYFLSHSLSMPLLWITLGLVFVAGLSITAGYHRLYSHTTYKVHPAIEIVLLFFASLATQGSALRWCFDHRLHHAFVDKERDPYSVNKGFWHAHIFWMFFKTETIDPKVIADLWRKKILRFQHDYYPYCMVGANLIVFLVVGWALNDYWGAFLFAWWVRLFLLHHTTWSINSLAHYWGSQSYSQEHSAVDNYLISLVTYGEGYHNYHHTFSQDYRNGIRWYHFDPSKWIIWLLHKCGLAHDLKTVNNYRIARELVQEHKDRLIVQLNNSFIAQKENLRVLVSDVSESLSSQLGELQKLLETYRAMPREEARALVGEIKSSKRALKMQWKAWGQLLRFVAKVQS
jgi:stearoyl-CoA desaturase (delta-9 desaturase)